LAGTTFSQRHTIRQTASEQRLRSIGTLFNIHAFGGANEAPFLKVARDFRLNVVVGRIQRFPVITMARHSASLFFVDKDTQHRVSSMPLESSNFSWPDQ